MKTANGKTLGYHVIVRMSVPYDHLHEFTIYQGFIFVRNTENFGSTHFKIWKRGSSKAEKFETATFLLTSTSTV